MENQTDHDLLIKHKSEISHIKKTVNNIENKIDDIALFLISFSKSKAETSSLQWAIGIAMTVLIFIGGVFLSNADKISCNTKDIAIHNKIIKQMEVHREKDK